MRRGEKAILGLVVLFVAAAAVHALMQKKGAHYSEIPFYSTATPEEASKAMDIYRSNGCKSCHSLWTVQDMMQFVPAPILDGIGSLRSESWLYAYLSSTNPQKILPSRLKQEYQMPSYKSMPDGDRRLLAKYLASLKVKDWYLEQTRQAEQEKLTGIKTEHAE